MFERDWARDIVEYLIGEDWSRYTDLFIAETPTAMERMRRKASELTSSGMLLQSANMEDVALEGLLHELAEVVGTDLDYQISSMLVDGAATTSFVHRILACALVCLEISHPRSPSELRPSFDELQRCTVEVLGSSADLQVVAKRLDELREEFALSQANRSRVGDPQLLVACLQRYTLMKVGDFADVSEIVNLGTEYVSDSIVRVVEGEARIRSDEICSLLVGSVLVPMLVSFHSDLGSSNPENISEHVRSLGRSLESKRNR